MGHVQTSNIWVVNEFLCVSANSLVQGPLQSHKMAPKAKTSMKAKPLSKGKFAMKTILKKARGNKHSLKKGGGSSTDKKPATRKSLNKNSLAKLGKMTLAEKIDKAAETASNPLEAAKGLKQMMTKQEHSQAWSKHNIHMKGKSKKEQKEFQSLSKGEKGMEVAMHLLKTNVPKFMQWKESLGHSVSLDKREEWKSETQMLEQFGEYELQLHIESGRVEYREDPWTVGVWNYRDKGDLVKRTRVTKNREWSRGQEYEAEEEDEQEFQGMMDVDATTHLQRATAWGKGKKALSKGSGKKGAGRGKGKMLATKDKDDEEDEPTEEEEWKCLLAKAKRAKDHMAAAKADLLDAIQEAEKSKRLTKASKKDSEGVCQRVAEQEKMVKLVLVKRDTMKLPKAKEIMLEAAAALKACKDEAKELRALANKAGSKLSKK